MKHIICMAVCAIVTLFGSSCINEEPTDIKVISYNIRLNTKSDGDNCWDNRKHASINMINEEKPTIFGLQEALPGQVEYLAQETDRRSTINFYQPGNEDKADWIIDHIFFRGVKAKSFKVLRDKNYGAPYISDHYPVVMVAEF